MARSSSLVLLWAALASAQAPETASISGTVTDALTGAPILRAHVALLIGREKFGALTDQEGKYSITGVVPGHGSVAADRIGFVAYRGSLMELRAGDAKTEVDLQLMPTGAISGHVLGADGEPAQLVTVVTRRPGGGAAVTDAKGQFRIGGLDPGKYHVRAEPKRRELPPEIRSDGSRQVHYRVTEYGARVEVAPGSEVGGIDIALAAAPIVKVSGKVVGIPSGAKQASVQITGDEPDSNLLDFRTAPDGTFVFWGLDPGQHSARAYLQVSGSQLLSPEVHLEVASSDVEHIELRLAPPFEIAGRIQFEDDAAKAAFQEGAEHQVSLDSTENLLGDSFQADIAADGAFRLEKVQPGKYRVSLSGTVAYVKSLRLGVAEGDGNVLDVRNGVGGDALTLVVSAQTAEIGGTVSDDKGPANGAPVTLFGEGENSGQTTVCDTAGHYRFVRVRPGKYRLVTADSHLADTINRNNLWDDYAGRSAAVEIHAGDTLTQDLKANGRNR